MKPWKAVFVAMALVGFAPLVACEDQSNAAAPVDPLSRVIRDAEAGSDDALAKLEALSEEDGLAEHADLIGAAATRISQEAAEADFPKGFVSRWHRLFFATDPVQNASAQTRQEFVRSLYVQEVNFPDEIVAGEQHPIGTNTKGTLPKSELGELGQFWAVAELDRVTANGSQVWPTETGLTGVSSGWPLNWARGNGGGTGFGVTLIDDTHTYTSGEEVEIRASYDVTVKDQSTDPPTVFASWTEELVATSKVKVIFASSPIEPRPGEADIDTVLALLAEFEAGYEEAARKLVELGTSGELRPHADELGSLLAEALRDDWQPRIAAHFAEHGWEPERPGAHLPPTPNELSSLLIGLFYLAEPVSTATRETWLDVATAGVFAHHRLAIEDGERPHARLQVKTVTALVQTLSLKQVSGMGVALERVELDGESWPLEMSGSQRLTSVSPEPADNWRSRISARVWEQNTACGLSEEMISRLSQVRGPTLEGLRTHLELQLLHDDETPLATWPVTIDTPITLEPLDETAPNRR
jgi:hypothetical protein